MDESGKKYNLAQIICFSENGKRTAREVGAYLEKRGIKAELWLKSRYALGEEPFRTVKVPLADWTGTRWDCGLLVFVGALGIAVRAVASHVQSKRTDPAVLVLDEGKHFCIPLLSGHLGGANEWALGLAAHLGSIPVVTTATDLHHLFAVDVFAKKNGLWIDDMTLAKEVSAALLAGQTVGVYTELPVEGGLSEKAEIPESDGGFSYASWESKEDGSFSEIVLPRGLRLLSTEREAEESGLSLGVYIGYRTDCAPFLRTLKLIPDVLAVGIGCRKGVPAEAVAELFYQVMAQERLDVRAVGRLASIDLKKDEAGIVKLAGALGVPFAAYDADTLNTVSGTFSVSAFVQGVTGVDNVCERSAVLASGNGTLIRKKIPGQGVTAAVAVGNRRIRFE